MIRRMRGAWPVHPVLLAAFPILFLWAENVGETEPREVIGPLALAVGAVIAALAAAGLVVRERRRAALLVSIGVLGFFLYGHVLEAVRPLRITEGRLLLGWAIAGAALVAVVLRTRADLRPPTALANLVGALLVVNSVVTLGGYAVSEATAGTPAVPAAPSLRPAPSPSPSPGGASGGQLRDIYYLVVEDYGSARTIDEYLGLHDDGLFDWLESQGFAVLRDTRSNYGRTPLSLASSLNMTYLDEVAAGYGPDFSGYAPITRLVRAPEVARFLRERGYTFAQLGSQYTLTASSDIADVNPRFRSTSDFQAVLYDTTILPAIAGRLGIEDGRDGRRVNYDAVRWQLERFPEIAALPGPKFVFMHLFLPHHPFVVDASGAYVPRSAEASRSREERYQAQWSFVHREMQALIEGLLDVPEDERPIIVFTTDEGPNPEGMPTVGGDIAWGRATTEQLDQKFSIFAAYLLPGVDPTQAGLYPEMSSVNSFRVVFNAYFDAGLPLLPDRNWIHRDKHHPYDLTDVTERLDALAAG